MRNVLPSRRPGGLWRNADFLKLWLGQTVSLLGSQITLVALPLAAIIALGAAPLQVGLLAAAGNLPTLCFGLVTGVWVDRLRRRPLMIAADAGRAVLLLGIPLGALLGWLTMPYLYVVAFLVGSLGLVFDVAASAFLPTLVGRAHLIEAGAKFSLSTSAAEVVGPGLAGVLVQWLTAPLAILFDAASFLVSAFSVALIRVREVVPKPAPAGQRLWAEARAGFQLVLGSAVLRPLIGSTGWVTFWSHVLEAVMLLYLVRGLGLAPGLIGIILAVGNVGLLAGAVSMTRIVGRVGAGAVLVAALLMLGLADLVVPLVGITPWRGTAPVAIALVLIGAQFLFGLAVVVYSTTASSLRLSGTPDDLRGRMSATTRVLVRGLTPLGSVLGGVLGASIGLQATLFLAAGGELLAALWLLTSPVRTLRELPEPVAD